MYAPEQHDLYDGHYVLSANRIHMIGGLNDPVGWDHIDNEARTVKPVSGSAEIDMNDLTNSGRFEARLKIPEGDLVLAAGERTPQTMLFLAMALARTHRLADATKWLAESEKFIWPARGRSAMPGSRRKR